MCVFFSLDCLIIAVFFFAFFWPLSNVLLIVSFNSNKRANKHTSRLNNNRFSSKLSIKLNNNSSECKNQVLLQS